MIKKIVNFFGDPAYRRQRRWLFSVALILTVAADFLVTREHGEFFWETLPGWGAFYGFISCVLIIVVSKFLGHQCRLMRGEDYYD